ncbi:MAG: hypothetical protein ACKVVT_01905 [Dehalococcoidia bacterium]
MTAKEALLERVAGMTEAEAERALELVTNEAQTGGPPRMHPVIAEILRALEAIPEPEDVVVPPASEHDARSSEDFLEWVGSLLGDLTAEDLARIPPASDHDRVIYGRP